MTDEKSSKIVLFGITVVAVIVGGVIALVAYGYALKKKVEG